MGASPTQRLLLERLHRCRDRCLHRLRRLWLLLAVFWIGYAVHSWLQASTGTTVMCDRIVVRDRRTVTEIPWTRVVRIRPDLESRWASHLVAELQDGTEVQLAMIPLDARDAVLAWAPPSVQR